MPYARGKLVGDETGCAWRGRGDGGAGDLLLSWRQHSLLGIRSSLGSAPRWGACGFTPCRRAAARGVLSVTPSRHSFDGSIAIGSSEGGPNHGTQATSFHVAGALLTISELGSPGMMLRHQVERSPGLQSERRRSFWTPHPTPLRIVHTKNACKANIPFPSQP